MPIVFRLLSQGQIITLPDPAGGEFNAAGDIDRLLPIATDLPLARDFDLPVLGRVEAFEDVEFTTEDMPAIAQEALALTSLAKPGPETRGLDRLRTMAEHGQRMPEAIIRSIGD